MQQTSDLSSIQVVCNNGESQHVIRVKTDSIDNWSQKDNMLTYYKYTGKYIFHFYTISGQQIAFLPQIYQYPLNKEAQSSLTCSAANTEKHTWCSREKSMIWYMPLKLQLHSTPFNFDINRFKTYICKVNAFKHSNRLELFLV